MPSNAKSESPSKLSPEHVISAQAQQGHVQAQGSLSTGAVAQGGGCHLCVASIALPVARATEVTRTESASLTLAAGCARAAD